MAVENLLKFIGLTISMWMITLKFTSQLGRCICIVSISPYHLCCGFFVPECVVELRVLGLTRKSYRRIIVVVDDCN